MAMLSRAKLNNNVTDNFINLKLGVLIPPFLLLFLFGFYFVFFNEGGSYIEMYVTSQKESFFYINAKLSQFPNLQFNLTQLGDVLLFFPLITVFIVYAPKLWGALLTSAIISLVVAFTLKKTFAVPRPAAMFDHDSFVIIGKTLSGRTSLPSGHSIATFIVISILLVAFMPKENKHKIIWSFFMLTLGFVITFSRVGVGAHYPLDVIIGSTIGFIVAIIGIKINNKVSWWAWIKNKKYYPIFMLLLPIWIFLIIKKIQVNNLPIFYFSIFSLAVTFYLITNDYVKNK